MHSCTPKCKLCRGDHITGERSCNRRYHVPYIVRKRRRDRRSKLLDDQEEGAGMVTKQWTSDAAARQRSLSRANSSSRARFCSTEASRTREREHSRGRPCHQHGPRGSAGSRSRSRSRSKAKLTWADKVRSGRAAAATTPAERDRSTCPRPRLEVRHNQSIMIKKSASLP
ncbi:hypothetical protein HPB51_023507 [Rhipicephalus microplus]|uniref:Uncharacterized protein n=1 Tax=Rhipicephalus microplus TaxID=6941 RepID=A0A9J6EIT1_RHIMP|nr:hypothetical protein HPB51_023507 [Rhipicephalus microplus]